MTAKEFQSELARLVAERDTAGMLRLASKHLDAVKGELTPDEYAELTGGPLEWAAMCEARKGGSLAPA
ncbi:MAG TPA: hypothetical protein VFU47_04800 [Armatimonadota bacterium]|nr:hypothetical protein [Armatimonadota bacterium]